MTTTPDFATIEKQLRAEAEKSIAVAKRLAEARKQLLDARKDFADIDARNLAAVEAALTAARAAGFDNKTLAALHLADKKPTTKKPTRRPARKPSAETTATAKTPKDAPTRPGADTATTPPTAAAS